MDELSLYEKINLLIKSSEPYRGILFLEIFGITIGTTIIFYGFRVNDISLTIVVGIWIALILFVMLYTMPSTISYYYEKALTAKYGQTTYANVVGKEMIDNSYHDNEKLMTDLDYQLTFSFKYKNQTFENADWVDKDQFEKLQVGDLIPIKFLSFNPKTSSIRKRKLEHRR